MPRTSLSPFAATPTAFAQSARGDVRVGPLAAFPGLIDELGASAESVFARAGISLRKFRRPDSRMAMDRLGRLVAEATRQTGCPDFAMMAGLRFDIGGLGPIGELMQHSTTVSEALRSLVLHLHLHDRGAVPVLHRLDARTTLLGYAVHRAGVPALDLACDVSTGIVYRVLVSLCGPDFRPTAIRVSARAQSRAAHYRKHFGCPVRFDSGTSGVVFASRWMDHPVAGADPQRRSVLQRQFAEAEARSPITFAQRVEVVMLQMLLAGVASGPAVAELFGLSERSLRRHLDAEGRSVRELLGRARFEQARQMLEYTGLPVGEIASALQYRDANAFSRAFRSWAGCTATQWRAGSRWRGNGEMTDA